MREDQQPLLRAILYADIFNYALSRKELLKYAVGKCTTQTLNTFISNPPSVIYEKDGYYCLKESKVNIILRKKREKISKEKLEKAKTISTLLTLIPSVKFIGVSGAVAVNNAEMDDDIDLFIITGKNAIWKTRLIVTLVVKLLGKKRSKNEKNTHDKICLNMFMQESSLAFNKQRRDLYTAHEIIQLVPLIDKQKTYATFLKENEWVKKFLPQAVSAIEIQTEKPREKTNLSFSEKIAKKMQLWYMRNARTKEEVGDDLLAFHPLDYRNKTLKEFEQRIKKYEKV